MSDHSSSDVKYEFKHDTNNFIIFSVLFVSIAFVTLIMAIAFVITKEARDHLGETDASSAYQSLVELRDYEEKNSTSIEVAMKQVVQEYNK